MMNPETDGRPPEPGDADDGRTSVLEYVRETWSQALAGVNAGEEEVQKILARLGGWIEVGPEEARRLGGELTDRLREQRLELEENLQAAVRRALLPFRLPAPEQVQELATRIDQLEERIDRLIAARR